MIPLAIIAAAWIITTAGSLLYANNEHQKRKAAELAQAGAVTFEGEVPAELRRIIDGPGIQSELTNLTTHLGQFERVADPHTDLDYARKILGETEPEEYEGLTVAEKQEYDLKISRATEEIIYSGGPRSARLYMKSPADPEASAEAAAGFAAVGLIGIAAAHTPGIIAEAASLGQIESVTWTIMDTLNASGIPAVVAEINKTPYDTSLIIPSRYHYQFLHRPFMPKFEVLPQFLARGQISAEEYLTLGGYQGYRNRWAVAAWNAYLKLPGYRELQIMRWRELIDDMTFKETLLRDGWHPDTVDEMLALTWQIPPYPDLIKLMVREIITPDDFITWIGRQGFGPGWAEALYEAHFRLPAYGNLVDALHRGLISEAEIRKYIFWWDYKPTSRPGIEKSDLEIMRGLFKTLIPRVDLRWGYRIGQLDADGLKARYGWLGYEEDAGLMTDIQIARATAPERRALSTQYLRSLRQGTISEAHVRAKLKELKYPPLSVDMMIEAEYIRRDIGSVELGEEPRTLTTSQVLAAFRKNLLSLSAARVLLIEKGWASHDAEILIAMNTPRPEENPPATAIKTAASNLYREGYLDPDEFEGLLRAANYPEADIATIRTAEDLRYRYDFLKDLERSDLTFFREDLISADDLLERLILRGMRPERAEPIVLKELAKKLPKAAD